MDDREFEIFKKKIKTDKEIKRIGYWRVREDMSDVSSLPLWRRNYPITPDFRPWPNNFNILSVEEEEKVVNFLNSGELLAGWLGWSDCRICGKMNGTICMYKEHFIYPEGYAHYIQDHHVLPDSDLLNFLSIDVDYGI